VGTPPARGGKEREATPSTRVGLSFGRDRGEYRAAIYAEALLWLWITSPWWLFIMFRLSDHVFFTGMFIWSVGALLVVLHIAHRNAGVMEAGLDPCDDISDD
jgi:hypothetical protein